MKKILLSLAMLFLMMVGISAQQEFHVEYQINVSSEDPDMQMGIAMFEGSNMHFYSSGEFSRMEIDFGFLMSMTTLTSEKSGEVLICMGGLMGDKAILTNNKEMGTDTITEVAQDQTITLTNETKIILGYTCKKAIIKNENDMEIDYWFTDKIKPNTTDKSSVLSKLPGLAMEYSTFKDGMQMVFSAKNIELKLDEDVKSSKFSFTIPEGFEEMTYEEFMLIQN